MDFLNAEQNAKTTIDTKGYEAIEKLKKEALDLGNKLGLQFMKTKLKLQHFTLLYHH